MSLPADILNARAHPIWDTRRLWSLADMINFYLGVFWNGLQILGDQIRVARLHDGDEKVNSAANEDIHKFVQVVTQQCVAPLHLVTAATGACVRLEDMWFHHQHKQYTYKEISDELERLYNEIRRDADREYFFHYPREMATLAIGTGTDPEWITIIKEFPSAKREIETGIDCYAFEDWSGCVFHMVRIAELALRTIAGERGVTTIGNNKPLEWGMWGDVFKAIDTKVEEIRNKPAGPKRDIADSFYRGAVSDLRFLQTYRDPAMHFRDDYGKGQSYDAMYRVKALMKTLASKLSEGNTTPIDWGL